MLKGYDFMSYAVARMIKVKRTGVTGIQRHNQRQMSEQSIEQSASKIDSTLTHLNYDLVNESNINYAKKIQNFVDENTKRKPRSDAVLTAEWVLTSDKAFFENLSEDETKRYFEKNLEYFQIKFGEEKMLYATVHMDEQTPHMHLGIIPFDDEKKSLNARGIFNRQTLREIQDELPAFLKEAGFDVERGEENSKAKHMSVLEMRESTADNREAELNEYHASVAQTEYDLESVKMSVEDELSVLDMRKAELTQAEQSIDKRLDDVEEKETQAQQKFARAMQRERESLQTQENLRKREEELEEKEKMYEEKVANLAEREQQLDEKISVIKISERILNNRKEKFEQDKEQTIQQILSLPDNPRERLILKESRRNENGQKIARDKTITSQKAQQNIANNFANKQRNNDGPEL